MASAWTVPPQQSQHSYTPSGQKTKSKQLSSNKTKVGFNWKHRVALLVRRALSMSNAGAHQSCCSHQSRVLLAAMRTQLAIALEERDLTPSRSAASPSSYSAIVSCNICGGFMVKPVCMPCGHSVCKACTEKSTMLSGENLVCPKCNQTFPKIPKALSPPPDWREEEGVSEATPPKQQPQRRVPTLTLQNAFCKWYPQWVESCQCREEGNKYANQGDFVLAAEWYTRALETGNGQ